MADTKKHSLLTSEDGIHIANAWTVADLISLEALAPTVDDVNKLALVEDTGVYHRLTGTSPITWQKTTYTAADIKVAYESNTDTNALTDALLTLLTTKKVKDVTTDTLNDRLVITYTDDTTASLNMDDIVTDIYVSGATLDAATNVLTLTSTSGGADVTVNLSDFVNSSELTTALADKVSKVTSTDNSIVRFDGITGDVQNSLVTVDDSGNIEITTVGEGLILKSANGTRYKITINEDGSLQTTGV